jgi:putative PIN family toxin of toxin-antitoxin system
VRACIDTNILISYLLGPGSVQPPSQVVRSAYSGTYSLVIVETTLHELRQKVTSKSYLVERIADQELQEFVRDLREVAEVIPQPSRIPAVTRDRKDDYLVAPAVLEQVDFIVTGDKDLLEIGDIAGVLIVSPARFVRILAVDA